MAKKYKYCETFMFEGRRIYVRADSKRELAEKIALRKKELEDGSKRLKPSQVTVRVWFNDSFDLYKNNLAPLTLQSQKARCDKWILSEIGGMRVKDVKPVHCQRILNNMDGKATDTVKKVRQLLRWGFDKAVQNDIIKDNPAQYISMPRTSGKKSRRAITEYERQMILKVADTDERFVFFLVMLFCGLRPSEVAGLKGMDVKRVENVYFLHVEGTKSASAVRDVPIPDYLLDRLPKRKPFDYLFTNASGRKMTRNNNQTLWNAFKRALNIAMGCKVYRNEVIPPFAVAGDLVPYCLRHTYCTDLQKKGVDVRTAQYLMGHSSIQITADIYTHTDKSTLLNVAEVINDKKDSENVNPEVVDISERIRAVN